MITTTQSFYRVIISILGIYSIRYNDIGDYYDEDEEDVNNEEYESNFIEGVGDDGAPLDE